MGRNSNTTPRVIVAGFAYRLGAGGLEHTLAARCLTADGRWLPITVETEAAQRARSALQILTYGAASVDGTALSAAAHLATDRTTPRLGVSDLTFSEAMAFPDRGTREEQDAYLAQVARNRQRKAK